MSLKENAATKNINASNVLSNGAVSRKRPNYADAKDILEKIKKKVNIGQQKIVIGTRMSKKFVSFVLPTGGKPDLQKGVTVIISRRQSASIL